MSPLLLALAGAALAAEPTETWAMRLRVASSAAAPLFGQTMSWTDTLLRVSVQRDAAGAAVEQVACAVEVHDTLPIASTEIPPAFVRALSPRRYRVQTGPDGLDWKADLGVDTVGIDPARVPGGLPATADAPGVVDWDGDGAPGATVRVKVPVFAEVDIYVVQRAHTHLDGRLEPGGEVRGQVHVESLEQRVIGAEREMFAVSPELSPVPEQSRFWMRPVPAEADCAWIVEQQHALFGPPPS